MGLLKVMGIGRVNWQYYGDIDRDSYWHTGFNVYEMGGIVRPSPDGSALIPRGDKIERIRAKARELGIYS